MTDNSFPKHAVVLAIQVLALQAVIAVSPAAAAERAGGFIRVADEQPLPPYEAFRLRISVRGPNTVIAELAPAKNHYLYKNKVHFAVKNSSGVLIKEVRLPENDQFFGTMEVYRKPIQAEIALDRSASAKKFTLLATYQGCNEKVGVCYPPIEKSVDLVLP